MQRPLPVKMAEAVDLGGRQRRRIAGDPSVEAGRRRHQRALVGGERLGDVVRRDLPGPAGTPARRPARSCRGARGAPPRSRGVEPISSGCSTGKRIWSSRLGARPSQNSSGLQATFQASACGARAACRSRPCRSDSPSVKDELGIVAGGAGDGAGRRQLACPRTGACPARPWRRSADCRRGWARTSAARTWPSARRAGRPPAALGAGGAQCSAAARRSHARQASCRRRRRSPLRLAEQG